MLLLKINTHRKWVVWIIALCALPIMLRRHWSMSGSCRHRSKLKWKNVKKKTKQMWIMYSLRQLTNLTNPLTCPEKNVGTEKIQKQLFRSSSILELKCCLFGSCICRSRQNTQMTQSVHHEQCSPIAEPLTPMKKWLFISSSLFYESKTYSVSSVVQFPNK